MVNGGKMESMSGWSFFENAFAANKNEPFTLVDQLEQPTTGAAYQMHLCNNGWIKVLFPFVIVIIASHPFHWKPLLAESALVRVLAKFLHQPFLNQRDIHRTSNIEQPEIGGINGFKMEPPSESF